jgi:hypothetical protein
LVGILKARLGRQQSAFSRQALQWALVGLNLVNCQRLPGGRNTKAGLNSDWLNA